MPPAESDPGAERPAAGEPPLPSAPSPEVLARLAHELRTPLAAIHSLADVMAQGTFGPLANPRYKEYAESIRDTAHHAIGVVRAMLDPEGLDQQVPEQTFTELDLNEIALQALRSVEPMAHRAGLVLDCEQEKELPRVIADRTAVQQIVLNLLSNSVEHAASGGRALVRTGRSAGEVWVEFEDNGPGFSLEARIAGSSGAGPPRVPVGTQPKGLGLRLAVALARANGARLESFERLPSGSRVRLSFSPSRAIPV